MTIDKTKFGLPFLDDAVGGVYFGLPTLVKGARDSGKTVLAAHFADRVLRIGEKVIFFCESAPEAVVLEARSAGIDLEPAARSGQLMLIPLRDALASARGGAFPFDAALAELHALATRSSIGFAVFSSVVPWLAATPTSDMPPRVDAFLAALAALSLTSLLLVHRPASAPAGRLVEKLSSACPVVLEMEAFESAQRELHVVKYDGRDDLRLPIVFPLDLVPGKGLVPPAPAKADVPETAPETAVARPAVAPVRRRHTLFGGAAAPAAAADPVAPHPKTPSGGADPAARRAAVAQHAAAAKRRTTLFSAVPEPEVAPAPPPAAAPVPPPAQPAPSPVAPAPQRRPTLFSSVIGPESGPANAAPPKPAPEPQPPPNKPSRIRFSDVIR